MKPLRILHICASSGNIIGGMENQVLGLCAHLAEDTSTDVHLAGGATLVAVAPAKAQTHQLPTEHSRRNKVLKWRLQELVSSLSPQVIHAHGLKAADLTRKLKLPNDTKRVVTIHGHKRKLSHLESFDACIGVSKEIVETLKKQSSKAHLIENGIAQYCGPKYNKEAICSMFGLPKEQPVLLCAGRLAEVKRFAWVIRACRELPVSLLIAGQGDQRSSLENHTSKHVQLTGHRGDIHALMSGCDALVIASKREGMSLSMIEALALETPVLSTKVSGAATLLPESGLLDDSSEEDFKASLANALNKLNTLKPLQKQSFDYAQTQLNIEKTTHKTRQLYDALTTKPELLFLGDCNTCGTKQLSGKVYADIVSESLSKPHINCGQTMSTTREALRFFDDHMSEQISAVFIQYGLVDSWQTIKAAPYVLYYPDTKLRRFCRRWVKKWKKYGRKLGIGRLFGMQQQVPLLDYVSNIETIIKRARCPVFLIETAPNHDSSRNPAIGEYNNALARIAESHADTTCIKCFDDFSQQMTDYYQDPTHFSAAGHTRLAEKIIEQIKARPYELNK